jgi:anthranilate phosphoribosyltransferase
MIEYLKKVGVGKERAKDLTYEEAYDAQSKILNGQSTDIQTGAFWSSMRMKQATEEELKGFTDCTANETNFVETELNLLDLAVPYDGKNKTIHILPASIFIASGVGVNIAGHGSDKVPSKFGITYQEVLNEMGCGFISDKEKLKKALELSGFAFYHQKFMNPKLYNLLPKRKEFGLRSYLNTVEKLLNPFKSTKIIIGFTHKAFIERYLQVLYHRGFKDIYIVKGLEGGVEPFVNQTTSIKSNKAFSLNINAKELNVDISLEKINFSVEKNAEICLKVLKNEKSEYRDWAVLTSAILAVVYGITSDIKEAYSLCEQSLNDMVAYEKFEIYKNISNS